MAEKETGSRTRLHVLGAFGLTVAMGVILAMAPFWGVKDQKRAQLQEIQKLAQVDLQFVAQAQAKFHAQFGTYTTDLNALGVAPKRVLYKFGFVSPAQGLPDLTSAPFEHRPQLTDLDLLKEAIPKLETEYSTLTGLAAIDLKSLQTLCPDCSATKDTFRVIAAANLDEDAALDVWTINEKGELVHLQNDFATP